MDHSQQTITSTDASTNDLAHVFAAPRVLVADDDPNIRRLLEISLRGAGYDVLTAVDGHELVQMAQQYIPQLVLVDLMMPHMDGYEAIRQMRNDTRIGHIPMLILTARMRSNDIVIGFDTGADDYISKPFDIIEVLARVRSHLRRAARQPLRNPLSGLPGGALVAQELQARINTRAALAVLYADLDNFKTFNDTYGFSRGDRAILLVSQLLQKAISLHGSSQDFVGHVGGDDFVVLTSPDVVDVICHETLAAFDREVCKFYQAEDWQRGYLSGVDRFGVLRRFRLLTLSIGGVTNRHRTFDDVEELAQIAAQMKQHAKIKPGSSYAIDQRTIPHGYQPERRKATSHQIIVVSADSSLRELLRVALQHAGYTALTASDVDEVAALHTAGSSPAVILADIQLGAALQALYAAPAPGLLLPQIVLLSYVDIAPGYTISQATILELPLPLASVIDCVGRLVAKQP